MDVLVVFGRGIEKVRSVRGHTWKPARYIEKRDSHGSHSGIRAPGIRPNDSESQVVIAGANANVIAAAHLFQRFALQGEAPHRIVFAAGRPAYIANDPDPALSEGMVLKERFLRLVDVGTAEIIVQSNNRNTRDDLLQSLQFVHRHGYRSLAIVSIELHLPRIKAFLQLALLEDKALAGIDVGFYASENVLCERSERYRRLLSPIRATHAYDQTAAMEAQGLSDLYAGVYNYGDTE